MQTSYINNTKNVNFIIRLGLVIFKEITKIQIQFILICYLRIAKYITFKEKDKIFVLKFLELHLKRIPFDFENLIQISIQDLDNLIVYSNPENQQNPPKKKQIFHKEEKKNLDDNDIFDFPNISAIKNEKTKKVQINEKSGNPSPKKKNNQQEADIFLNPPSSPKFNFKGLNIL